MPGHYMIYDLSKNKISKIKRYWKLNFGIENKKEKILKAELKNLLFDSIKKRLMSDVPFGAYISGGVDSGAVVSIMKNFCSKPIETFSVGFENEEYSETDEARFLAEKLGTNHHQLLIKEDSVKYLPKIVYHLDEPMSDPTSIPIYLLSKYTKKYCTVILTGEGSDELFAGYPQYKFMKFHNTFIRNMPKIFRRSIPLIVNKIPKNLLNYGFKFASELGEKGTERFSNFVNSNSYSEQYLNQISIFNEQEKKELFARKYNKNLYKQYSGNFKKDFLINSCSKFDFEGNMAEDLLMKLDKNTMAFSIEGRVPFLDHRLVELAFKIPEKMKLRYFIKDKFILREIVKDILPRQTCTREKKHFFVPINNWFNNELLQLKENLLSKQYIEKQGIFKYNYIKRINEGFKKSRLFYSRQLWSLITFQVWYKQYIENEKIEI